MISMNRDPNPVDVKGFVFDGGPGCCSDRSLRIGETLVVLVQFGSNELEIAKMGEALLRYIQCGANDRFKFYHALCLESLLPAKF